MPSTGRSSIESLYGYGRKRTQSRLGIYMFLRLNCLHFGNIFAAFYELFGVDSLLACILDWFWWSGIELNVFSYLFYKVFKRLFVYVNLSRIDLFLYLIHSSWKYLLLCFYDLCSVFPVKATVMLKLFWKILWTNIALKSRKLLKAATSPFHDLFLFITLRIFLSLLLNFSTHLKKFIIDFVHYRPANSWKLSYNWIKIAINLRSQLSLLG